MATQAVEHRRDRRIDLSAVTVSIRNLESKSPAEHAISGQVKDVSLTGLLASIPAAFSLRPGTSVSCEVTVPRESRKQFPFARIIGEGWVVRVQQPQDANEGESSVEVAVAFAGTATALGAIDSF